jgi:hyperosmotically inducible periplasmic protein
MESQESETLTTKYTNHAKNPADKVLCASCISWFKPRVVVHPIAAVVFSSEFESMKVLLALLVGMALGVAAIWYLRDHKVQIGRRTTEGQTTFTDTSTSSSDKLESMKLRGEDIKEELAKTGRIIRDKAEKAGQKIADATADTRTTATIKAKYVSDPDLSAWNISVNTTDGVVTLSGTVSSEDKIGKAMLLALETDGVQQVVSTLQVKAEKSENASQPTAGQPIAGKY